MAFKGSKTYTAAGQTGDYTAATLVNLDNGAGGTYTPVRDDFVIVMMATGSTADRTLTLANSGWTKLTELYANGTTTDTNLAVWYKTMDVTPDTTLTFTGGSGSIQDALFVGIMCFNGVDPVTPFDITEVSASEITTGRPDPGAINPPNAVPVVVCMASAAGTGTVYTRPAGYSSSTDYWKAATQADTNDVMGAIAYHSDSNGITQTNPGAVTTGGTTGVGDSWAAYTLALKAGSPPTRSFPPVPHGRAYRTHLTL